MNYNKQRSLKLLSVMLTAVLLVNLIMPTHALAWKPTTHVYLADIALQDALDDGQVTIYRVNYISGEILDVIGEYDVDPDILAALQSNAAQYRAGTIGPDGYPDILTGQQVIHPEPNYSGVEQGPDAWLTHLWTQSNSTTYQNNKAIRAYTVGFLTHAAGDLYAHTFVNYFTGGPFAIDPIENGVKHILLEGYIDDRLPGDALDADFFDPDNMNIRGVEDDNNDFIYRTMIDARPGTILDTELLVEGTDGTRFSIPRIFSTIRADLEEDIKGYDCKINPICYAEEEYKKEWLKDIDEGLRFWPQTSHQLIIDLGFNPEREVRLSAAVDVGEQYVLDHLLSMYGFPDVIPDLLEEIEKLVDALIPGPIQEIIDEYKEELLNKLLMEGIGMNKEQLKEFLTSPNIWFDVAMDSGSGEDVTLERFNTQYLRITDTAYDNPAESFDYTKFRPAYNTVTLSKLVLLNQDEVNRLLSDLGSDVRLEEPNIMLGFASTLDGDNQWLNGMVLAQDRQVYEQLFMRQAGERLIITGNGTSLTALDGTSASHYIFLPTIFKAPLINPCFEREATIVGTEGDDTLVGTSGNDVIVGKGGNDVITGGEGNDFICGGPGDDTINGNQGRDFVQGNMGNDIVRGGMDHDVVRGGMDNDQIYGDLGNDKIYGGKGDDQIDGNEGYNLIFAGDGFDTCAPNIGNFECEN